MSPRRSGRGNRLFSRDSVDTDIIEIDAEQPDPAAITRAAGMLRRGRVVAIPTDALYTLVADPFNLRALSRVFGAKGRNSHRSLPLLSAAALMSQDRPRDVSLRSFG